MRQGVVVAAAAGDAPVPAAAGARQRHGVRWERFPEPAPHGCYERPWQRAAHQGSQFGLAAGGGGAAAAAAVAPCAAAACAALNIVYVGVESGCLHMRWSSCAMSTAALTSGATGRQSSSPLWPSMPSPRSDAAMPACNSCLLPPGRADAAWVSLLPVPSSLRYPVRLCVAALLALAASPLDSSPLPKREPPPPAHPRRLSRQRVRSAAAGAGAARRPSPHPPAFRPATPPRCCERPCGGARGVARRPFGAHPPHVPQLALATRPRLPVSRASDQCPAGARAEDGRRPRLARHGCRTRLINSRL
eukprot:364310-Chlamydomonas_euryale.AAC.12